jgi:hypothetical protein
MVHACPSPGAPQFCEPGSPATRITVRFELKGQDQFHETVTDSSGRYSLSLPTGEYITKLVVVRQGGTPFVQAWDLGPKDVRILPLLHVVADFGVNMGAL